MKTVHVNYRWPVSLYWTIMFAVPVGLALLGFAYVGASYIAQFLLSR